MTKTFFSESASSWPSRLCVLGHVVYVYLLQPVTNTSQPLAWWYPGDSLKTVRKIAKHETDSVKDITVVLHMEVVEHTLALFANCWACGLYQA